MGRDRGMQHKEAMDWGVGGACPHNIVRKAIMVIRTLTEAPRVEEKVGSG